MTAKVRVNFELCDDWESPHKSGYLLSAAWSNWPTYIAWLPCEEERDRGFYQAYEIMLDLLPPLELDEWCYAFGKEKSEWALLSQEEREALAFIDGYTYRDGGDIVDATECCITWYSEVPDFITPLWSEDDAEAENG